jgi:hypothetical protein
MTTLPSGNFDTVQVGYLNVTDIGRGNELVFSSLSDGTATLSGGSLVGLVSPTDPTAAANKYYVDNAYSGGGITSLNGLTSNVQVFSIGSSGNDFNIVSLLDTHTFNIPSASSVSRGLLSSGDWVVFNNKLSNSLGDGSIYVGDSSNIARGVTMSGDGSVSNTGVFTLVDSGVTSGSYIDASISVDSKGRITSASNGPSYSITRVSSSNYSILETDYLVGVVYTTSGAVTLVLPEISTLVNKKKIYVIVDEGGNASTNHITISTSGSDSILGTSSVIISEDYNSVSVYSDELDKWYVY